MNPTETVTVPRMQFARLATEKSSEHIADIEAKLPRADELQKTLESLTAEAKAKGITLDDEATLKNPVAADLRTRIDAVVEEVAEILSDIERYSKLNKQMQAILADGAGTGSPVVVPAPLAAMMLNLKIPG